MQTRTRGEKRRSRAIQKMKVVLRDSVIFGVHTNIPYLIEILSHPEFVSGKMTTQFISKYFSEALKEPSMNEIDKAELEKVTSKVTASQSGDSGPSPWGHSWKGSL